MNSNYRDLLQSEQITIFPTAMTTCLATHFEKITHCEEKIQSAINWKHSDIVHMWKY